MGNVCGKTEDSDARPGRVLGSAPPAPTTAAVPRRVGGPPRTLGGGPGPAASAAPAGHDDARARAAEAAEARARAATNKRGKLQSQLAAQKRQSRSETLKQSSVQEQRARDTDAATRARNWD